MSAFDAVFVVLAVLAVVGGYRLGFVARVVSWVGLAAGLAVAVRLLPLFLDQLDTTSHGLVLVLSVGLLLVGASLGQALGFVIGIGTAALLRQLFIAFGADLPSKGNVIEARTVIVTILVGVALQDREEQFFTLLALSALLPAFLQEGGALGGILGLRRVSRNQERRSESKILVALD